MSGEYSGLAAAIAGASFSQYASALLHIENEEGEICSFDVNEAQQDVMDAVDMQQSKNVPVKLLILKGRQQGMSTLCQMLIAHRMFTQPGVRCLTVGHNLAAVHDLYGKMDRAIRQLPDFLRPEVEPGGERGRRMKLKDPERSSYRADSAHDPEGVARGMTVQVAHLTEIPQWSKPEETMQAILAAISDSPRTMILVESTAKGATGWFYEAWMDAQRKITKGEEPEFIPVFVPWFKTARYKRKRRQGEPALSVTERKFRDHYSLSNEQVYWYRDQQAKFGERVFEEYPSKWEEAFLTGGRPFLLQEHLKFYREEMRRAPIQQGGVEVNEKGNLRFERHATGRTHIFTDPVPGHRYVMGVDFAGGRAKDSSAIVIIDVDEDAVVCTHQSKMLPDDVLNEAVYLGHVYHTNGMPALMVPERNGIGEPLVDRLVHTLKYPNIFRDRDKLSVKHRKAPRYGWATTSGNRKWLLEEFASHVHRHILNIPCGRIIDEMHTLIYKDADGEHAEALSGSNDDLVMATAIAIRGYGHAPLKTAAEVTPRHRKSVISSATGY